MPGGRGTFSDIAVALNGPKPKKTAKAIKSWIDGDYRVIASVSIITAAYAVCKHPKLLHDIWCYAIERGKVDPTDY